MESILMDESTCEDDLIEECEYIEGGMIYYQLTPKFDDEPWFITLSLISSTVSAIFFFIQLWIPELQVHPMKLFMYICACDSFLLFQYSMSTRVCKWQFYKLFTMTTFHERNCENHLHSMKTLNYISMWLSVQFAILGQMLQLFVSFDLILCLMRPFTPKESRLPWYIIPSLLNAVFMALLLTTFWANE